MDDISSNDDSSFCIGSTGLKEDSESEFEDDEYDVDDDEETGDDGRFGRLCGVGGVGGVVVDISGLGNDDILRVSGVSKRNKRAKITKLVDAYFRRKKNGSKKAYQFPDVDDEMDNIAGFVVQLWKLPACFDHTKKCFRAFKCLKNLSKLSRD